MKKLIILLLLASGLFAQSKVNNAIKICKMIDSTGLASEKCEVSGWDRTLKMVFDMTSGDARKMCKQLTVISKQKKMNLQGWKIKIFSPYSNGRTIAYCVF